MALPLRVLNSHLHSDIPRRHFILQSVLAAYRNYHAASLAAIPT
jgi:hypothetical protein